LEFDVGKLRFFVDLANLTNPACLLGLFKPGGYVIS